MTWVWIVAGWVLVGLLVALVLGRVIRNRDRNG